MTPTANMIRHLSTRAVACTALALALGLAACASTAPVDARTALAEPAPPMHPAHGIPGIGPEQLDPQWWISRLADPDTPILDGARIAARNATLFAEEASMHVLAELPTPLPGAQVREMITALSAPPANPRYDMQGTQLPQTTLDGLQAALALDAIPAQVPARFGLVVRRTALRAFPTRLRAFSTPGDTDIDRFQESALFPGDPVAIVHASADGQWLFVISPRYAAWIEADALAEGSRERVLGYGQRSPYRIVTGATVRTVFTPEAPAVSELQLDMGQRIPLARLPPNLPVNGQHPYTAWTLDLPVRQADGRLAFAPALLPRIADSQARVLPLTRANLIRQGFKFLGERYGWGHDYNGRDCSGFISEIYRSMGLEIPRNTSRQRVNPALERIEFDARSSAAQREAALARLDIGDLVFIPGHVVMVIGRIGDEPYVIHDVLGGHAFDANGQLQRLQLNGVSVTPLRPMRFDADTGYVDRITHIVRLHP